MHCFTKVSPLNHSYRVPNAFAKRTVLRSCLKPKYEEYNLTRSGRLFQTIGPKTEKALSPLPPFLMRGPSSKA